VGFGWGYIAFTASVGFGPRDLDPRAHCFVWAFGYEILDPRDANFFFCQVWAVDSLHACAAPFIEVWTFVPDSRRDITRFCYVWAFGPDSRHAHAFLRGGSQILDTRARRFFLLSVLWSQILDQHK
jgi:hypothetical protein